MLGEYDLPNLKIAALHDHHKSLAVTLQFIGRLLVSIKALEKLVQASVVMNIASRMLKVNYSIYIQQMPIGIMY